MTKSEPIWALGLMSGTSLDGVDAALVETDGERILGFGAVLTVPYEPSFRERLRGTLGGKGDVESVARDLTLIHAEVVRDLLGRVGRRPGEVGVIGFHGHTILHEPEAGRTWQIGDGALLARTTGIDVVSDFRSADVAAGGQGAPLVPVFHWALGRTLARPLAVLNIGGVANVTWIGPDLAAGEPNLLAFDTGPGNAMIDDWVRRHTGRLYDEDGALARKGTVDARAIERWLSHPYFQRRPPKSLDRNAFSLDPVEGRSPEDGAATLAAFTAAAVRQGTSHFPAAVQRWLVGGGGRHNPAIMAALRSALPASVDPVETVGWNGDALEAQAFAFLAVRSRRGLPLSLPSTTGVARPTPGGVSHRAA
ncbi:MAG: anhydro-N-acetylmuramic acid kinase [Alphaproteobacteria bacterium]